MKVLAVGNEKGGTDEALTSLHLFGLTMPASRKPCKTHAAPIDLVPATRLLDAVPERATLTDERAAAHLREFKGYDIVIIDTPPTRGKLFRAALRAADAIVTPFEPKAESLRGIAGLIDTIGAVRAEHNPRLRHLGIVANRVPVDNIGAARLLEQLGEQVGALLLPAFMYERAAINAALAVRRPVWRTLRGEAHSLAAEEVHRVMREIWERLQ